MKLKRIFALFIAALMIISLCACVPENGGNIASSTQGEPPQTSVGSDPGDPAHISDPGYSVVFHGKVMSKDSGAVLMIDEEKKDEKSALYTVDLNIAIFDEDGKEIDESALSPGTLVDVTYSGLVLEQYPGILVSATEIRVVGFGGNIADMYLSAIGELWNEDKALNNGVSMIALDLSEAGNLSEAEKGAVAQIMLNRYGFEVFRATAEELDARGLIDKESKAFKDGVLFAISDEEIKDGIFSFTAMKWKSALGAVGFSAKAEEASSGEWAYVRGNIFMA